MVQKWERDEKQTIGHLPYFWLSIRVNLLMGMVVLEMLKFR